MLGEINDHNPNLFRSLSDPKLDRDIMVEMWELRDGGNRGRPGTPTPRCWPISSPNYAEAMRKELNGSVPPSASWTGGPALQVFLTRSKMLKVSPDNGQRGRSVTLTWSAPSRMRRPSARRSISDRHLPHDHHGHVRTPTPAERGVRVNPANMARASGRAAFYTSRTRTLLSAIATSSATAWSRTG